MVSLGNWYEKGQRAALQASRPEWVCVDFPGIIGVMKLSESSIGPINASISSRDQDPRTDLGL